MKPPFTTWVCPLLILNATACFSPPSPPASSGTPTAETAAKPADTPPTSTEQFRIGFPMSWADRAEVSFQSLDGPPEPLPSRPFNLEEGIILDEHLLFSIGSTVISAEAESLLNEISQHAAQIVVPGRRLVVHGYVDEQGSPESNEKLGQARADAVTARLVRLQPVLEGLVQSTGHGEEDLLHPECRGDCPENRVVVISIHP